MYNTGRDPSQRVDRRADRFTMANGAMSASGELSARPFFPRSPLPHDW